MNNIYAPVKCSSSMKKQCYGCFIPTWIWAEQSAMFFLFLYLHAQNILFWRGLAGVSIKKKQRGRLWWVLWLWSLAPFMSLSILRPGFGSAPSRPAPYLPSCPSCSDREIHTWRTLSVGYRMFPSPHCLSSSTSLVSSRFSSTSFPSLSHRLRKHSLCSIHNSLQSHVKFCSDKFSQIWLN